LPAADWKYRKAINHEEHEEHEGKTNPVETVGRRPGASSMAIAKTAVIPESPAGDIRDLDNPS